ncbi:LPXTG cell wall anchor domain-containing protein [Kitasatospora sp. NPDC001540]|uniref:LPXTG cell wall anchor domain-containing protein n=1 Tax=Kitasatospora sp. NPDC001540 TaxID=3364014 RepID=UPI0036A5F902
MRTSRSRSLGLATTLAALALGGTVAPAAHAADSTLKIEAPDAVAVDPHSTAPDHGSNSTQVHLDLTLSNAPMSAMGRVTVDLAPLQGIASVSVLSQGCTTSGQVLTCDAMSMYGGKQGLDLYLYGPDAAKAAGSSAVLHTTAVFNGATASADTKVTLGGSNVVGEELPTNRDLKPGDTWTPELKVTNKGQLPASQLYLTFTGGMELSFLPQFSNCQYATEGNIQICTVHTAVEPGETVTLSPIGFKVGSDAYYSYEDVEITTTAPDLSGWLGQFHFVPGQSSTKLTVVGKPDTSTPNGVIDFERGNYLSLQATVPNTADFAATGSWAPEAGKQQGKLTVGLVNNGPASIDWRSGTHPANVRVDLPAQAKVLQKPDNCYPASTDPAVNAFTCQTTPYVKNGYRASFDFTVQADPAAKLSAVVTLPSLGEDNQESGKPWDHNKANDVVTVALGGEASTGTPSPQPSQSTGTGTGGTDPSASPSPAPGTSSAVPSPSASASPSTGQNGTGGSTGGTGNLASTGGGQGSGTLLGLGIGAIALGGGVVLVTRRRKAGAQQ